jgi:hypothetical protein
VENLTGAGVNISPRSLVFGPATWDVPQAVSVEAANDCLDEPDRLLDLGAAATSADPVYQGLAAELQVLVRDNDTPSVIELLGPTSAVKGTTATFEAALRASDQRPVPDRTIHFRAQGVDLGSGVTDQEGVARVDAPVTGSYGPQELEVRFEGDCGDGSTHPEEFEADTALEEFTVAWEHAFADEDRVLRVNTITHELQFQAPGDVSAVRTDPDMEVQQLPTGDTVISIRYVAEDLMVVGRFLPERGTFGAVVRTPVDTYFITGTP